MALRNLAVGEMLSLTGPWIDPAHPERVLLDSVPTVAGMLRFIVQWHGALIGSQSGEDAARRAALTDELGQMDDRHDLLATAVSEILAGHRRYHQGSPLGTSLDALDQALFPDGLQIVRASYRDSAGRAEVRATLLTDDQRGLLSGIPVMGGTLLDWVNQWNQQAVRIGELVNQRDTPGRDPAAVRASREARNRWISTVRTMLDVIALEVRERPELQRILDRIAEIEAAADRRRAARAGAPDEGAGEPGDEVG